MSGSCNSKHREALAHGMNRRRRNQDDRERPRPVADPHDRAAALAVGAPVDDAHARVLGVERDGAIDVGDRQRDVRQADVGHRAIFVGPFRFCKLRNGVPTLSAAKPAATCIIRRDGAEAA